MEKYDSKIGILMFLLMVLFSFLTMFLFIIWSITGIGWPAIIITILFLFGFVPVYFFTNYKISSNTLTVRSGFFSRTINLDSIVSIIPDKNLKLSYATSFVRIQIVYQDNDKKLKTIYVSPYLFSTFLNDLTDLTLDNVILSEKEKIENIPTYKQEIEPEHITQTTPVAEKKTKQTTKKSETSTTPKKSTTKTKSTTKNKPTTTKKQTTKTKTTK